MSAELTSPIPSDVDSVIGIACGFKLPAAKRANRENDWQTLAELTKR